MSEVAGLQLRFPNLGRFDVPRVDRAILERIEDMYSGREGSTPKDSGGNNTLRNTAAGIYGSAALGTIPGVGPALQALGQSLTSLQTNAPLRSSRIRELAADENKRGTFNPATNSYSGLNIIDRIMDIRPDAVTSQIADTRKRDLENSDAVAAIKLELGEDNFNRIFPRGSATSNLEVEALASQIDTRKDLLERIENNQGTRRLTERRQELGRQLTNDELRVLNDEAQNSTPEAIRTQDQSDAVIRNVDSQIENRSDTLELSRQQERNRNSIARAEIDFKNQTNEYNYLNAKDDRDYKYRSAEADRELKKELALLGFEDRNADRRLDREERRDQNRQLLILQMMKGLQNLGTSFAL